MILTRKRRLRLEIRQQTALLARQEKLRQSEAVFRRVEKTEAFRKARHIGFFWSLTDEIPTHEVIQRWIKKKNVHLPVVDADGMHFVRFTEGCRMEEGEFRILVPSQTEKIEPEEIDLLVLPGVAFDTEGRRLGKGKGYYDRFMDISQAYRIGVCMEHQLIDEVPAEPHDKKVDMVVSPGILCVTLKRDETETVMEGHCVPDRGISLSESLI